MRFHPISLLVFTGALLGFGVLPAAANGCRPCGFAGLCQSSGLTTECGPVQADCVPAEGILLFNSLPPDVPVYWTLKTRGRPRPGRLVGRLRAFTDAGPARPPVPGFRRRRCQRDRPAPVCFGRSARFRGRVDGDRLTAVARWRGGATCEFAGTIRFGLGEPEPNWFICRDAGGQVLSEGPFDVQGIRLSGCLR
jgi:hypothetical protein